jgi:hypothetical protein
MDINFIRPDSLEQALSNVSDNMHVTTGSYEILTSSLVNDLDWNHMDSHHRPFIHKTYLDSLRLVRDKNFQISITQRGNTPLFITVVDVFLEVGLFYQIMTIFGIFTIISVIKAVPEDSSTRQTITWHIMSKRIFRFLHPILSRKLYRLNEVQNGEDLEIRERREKLRGLGYTFKTDEPNFLNSSDLSLRMKPPALKQPISIAIAGEPENTIIKFELEGFSLLYRRRGNSLTIWPGICPHEGAELRVSCIKDNDIQCHWHGLKYQGLELEKNSTTKVRYGYAFEFIDDELRISNEN